MMTNILLTMTLTMTTDADDDDVTDDDDDDDDDVLTTMIMMTFLRNLFSDEKTPKLGKWPW